MLEKAVILCVPFKALVSHNSAASQLIAPTMGRCLPVVKKLLAKAERKVMKVQRGHINGHHVPALDRTIAHGRRTMALSISRVLPPSSHPPILRLSIGLAVDFSKMSKSPACPSEVLELQDARAARISFPDSLKLQEQL